MAADPAFPDAPSLGPSSLTPVAGALSELLGELRPVEVAATPVMGAVGAVLAEALVTSRAVPERTLALRRGWAVTAAEVVGASSYSPMPLGRPPAFVEAGDPLPAGADAVLPPDAVTVEAGSAQALAETAPGEFVRRQGEDCVDGAVLLEAGGVVRPRHAALARLADVGLCRVRRPVLRILHDGSEGADAVASFVAGLAVSMGAEAIAVRSPGRRERADVVLMLGQGDPAGPDGFDHVIAASLAMRPGEAAACGLIEGVPALAAPARAAEALAVSLVLLRPVLARLAGAMEARPREFPLTRKIASTVGSTEIALLRETPAGFEPLGVGDLTLTALARAEAWLAVPPESEGFAVGEIVPGFPL